MASAIEPAARICGMQEVRRQLGPSGAVALRGRMASASTPGLTRHRQPGSVGGRGNRPDAGRRPRAGAVALAASGSRSWCRRHAGTARRWRPARGRWPGRRRAAPRTAPAAPRSAGPRPGRARSPPNQAIEHKFERGSGTLRSPDGAAQTLGGPRWGRNSAEPGGQQRTAGDNEGRGQQPFRSDLSGPLNRWTGLSHGRGHRFETCHAHEGKPQLRAPTARQADGVLFASQPAVSRRCSVAPRNNTSRPSRSAASDSGNRWP
jgi:hypothetical protein